jgi:class 3 adenylate cyclase
MAKHRSSGAQAVILHADIADSNELVQQDKRLAYQRIQDSFGRFSNAIEKYFGQVLEIRGDLLLAEFGHAADAVSASLAFQLDQVAYNERLRDDPRPTIRVGIAMGEIIMADNTITGWGVVQAQRVEQLADPGGVYITSEIKQVLVESLPIDFEVLGENTLRNFDYPDTQSVYRVQLKPGESVPPPDESIRREAPASMQKLMLAVIAATLLVIGGAAYWFKF